MHPSDLQFATTAPGAMDCSNYPSGVEQYRGNSLLKGIQWPFTPSSSQEADIIDMNPVPPGPTACNTVVRKLKTRRQLCILDEVGPVLPRSLFSLIYTDTFPIRS